MRRASMGEPASSASISPSCHCRVMNQSASRTSALRLREKSSLRGRGSSRLYAVIAGSRKISLRTSFPIVVALIMMSESSGMALFRDEGGGEAAGDCLVDDVFYVQGVIERDRTFGGGELSHSGRQQSGQALDFVDHVGLHRAEFCALDRIPDGANEIVPRPMASTSGRYGEQQRLQRHAIGLVVMKTD